MSLQSSGELPLKNGYKITDTIYHSMGDKYIPYIVGVIIQGPKGGKYVLDGFGVQHLFRYFNISAQQGVNCRLLDKDREVRLESKCLVRDKDLTAGKTNEECSAKYAKSHGCTYVKRSDVRTFIDKIRR